MSAFVKKHISADGQTLLNLYRTMVTIRTFELKVKELVQLNLVGGAAHLSIGQEGVAAGICRALGGDDQILSTHRGHGHAIAKGADIKRMLAEILGRATGYCYGKGGSMHIADPEIGIAGANGIVGGGLTIATGIGLACKLLKIGNICVCFFGDGAAAQGGLHEALNISSLWKLPVLFVCENNQYAMSSPVSSSVATDSIAGWAEKYGLKGKQVNGNDVGAVYEAATRAVEEIRSGGGAQLIECITYRQVGHYCGDPCLYRDPKEAERWIDENDPIKLLKQRLVEEEITTDKEIAVIDSQANDQINKASDEALKDPEPDTDLTVKDVYVDLWSQSDIHSPDLEQSRTVEMTYRDAANRAIDEEMARDERVIILGEDIGIHGGAFQVTRGLYQKYGEKRVRNTPISEEMIGGCTLGAALLGLRPIGEFQYSDFMTLAMDQIVNQTAKVHYMFGGKMTASLVYRAPCGSGGRGNACQHSQSLEAWFMHVPGLKVVMPATPFDMTGLLKTAIRDDDPVIFLEHKAIYNSKGLVPQNEYLLPFGKADIKRTGTDLTIVATSRMVLYSLEAAIELAAEGINVEVIDPRTLVPLDKETICGSVAKTGFAVIVSEDCITAGVSAEIASILNEEVFDQLDHPVVRLAGLDVPIPYNRALERASIPSVESISSTVKRILGV
jgi:pyruvate/2-oxoglutarate/acetoin dehydrogenase E1 component/TPP-dependent pyruvate/acetoin dehydrogenase alpha subunit